jgi:hypothetical protein
LTRRSYVLTTGTGSGKNLRTGHLVVLAEGEGYVFSDPSRRYCFVFMEQATEDIDPANAWHLG